jgi:tagatose 1,6-diphosphate aldolase
MSSHDLDSDPLRDGELRLVLAERRPADPAEGWVPMLMFDMLVEGEPRPVGRLHLRIGDNEHLRRHAGHVGSEVEPAWRGHRFAARAVALVLPVEARCGIDPVWITCNPDNVASIRTLEIVGAERVGEVDLPPDTDMYRDGERPKVRFRIPSRGTR